MGNLCDQAGELFAVACIAADPALALAAALEETALPTPDSGGVAYVVAIGKAAMPMATLVSSRLVGSPYRMIVVTNFENARDLPGATVLASAHPVPDESGARAADAVERVLASATAADRIIALISGGGSALLPAPAGKLSLADKAEVNRLLLANGFEITEINLVRQHLSRLKGGGFLRLAAPAPVTAYILSDVVGDDLRVIASGLTVAPVGTRRQARELLRDRGIWFRLPAQAKDLLRIDEADLPLPAAQNVLIGSNRKSLEAVAAAVGANATIVNDRLTGDVSEATAKIVEAAMDAPKGRPACLIFGGETTVTLRGTGQGGRNQELALRVSMTMPDLGRDWAFLSGGTDGRDGPTDAAGGIVNAGTPDRIRAAGGSPDALLSNNDSYTALKLAGDLFVTGATGTNVADVQILVLE